ncbi:MAG TPA: hypothetical protein VHB25_03485 [Gemmatimonadaceae bacterium]|nr:hypothetical protein [Gemmatimonadaceae bacterium]
MHSLARLYIKTAILYLMLGLGIGGWALIRRELGAYPSTYVISAHTHAILVGFVMLMILGVALWMFPRPAAEDERYSPMLATAAYWLVTVGTGVRTLGELARTETAALWLRWTIIVAGLLQIAGLAVFFYTMWSRIRPSGSRAREKAGERF